MKNIAFRVDAGPEIGIGHLMRCIALANAFPDDFKIIFISKPKNSVIKKLDDTRYEFFSIPEDIGYEDEIAFVKKVLEENEIDIFIGDTYQVHSSHDIDEYYLDEIKRIVEKTVVISPKVSLVLPCDILINGNVFATELEYKSSNEDTVLLLGPQYALLRKEFQYLPDKEIEKEVDDILVTMGGADPSNLIPKVLKAIHEIEEKDIHVDIVIGPAVYSDGKILESLKELEYEVFLAFNTKNISELMLKSDLAVSAGGGTLYELAVTGTPAIVLLQADNQIPVAEAMEEKGTIINMGFGNRLKVEKLADRIMDLINDHDKRAEMSRRGKELIDGLGAKRCVDVILDRKEEC